VNSLNEDLLERLQDRTRHLKTFVAAAEQAADESLTLVQEIGRQDLGEVEAHYSQLADVEDVLNNVRLEISRVIAELERLVDPEDENEA
jgi:hypothetical protein